MAIADRATKEEELAAVQSVVDEADAGGVSASGVSASASDSWNLGRKVLVTTPQPTFSNGMQSTAAIRSRQHRDRVCQLSAVVGSAPILQTVVCDNSHLPSHHVLGRHHPRPIGLPLAPQVQTTSSQNHTLHQNRRPAKRLFAADRWQRPATSPAKPCDRGGRHVAL